MSDRSGRAVGRPLGPTAKGAGTRKRIIESAATVFAQMGYDKARMTTLVDATGLTKGAVYFHFDSKEALALAVLETKHAEWLADVNARLAGLPEGRRRLEGLLPTMLAIHDDDRSVWAVSKLSRSLADLESDNPMRRHIARLSQTWVEMVADVIRRAQELREVRGDIDPVGAAVALVGAFDGVKAIHDTLTEGGEEPFASGASALGSMILTGLMTPDR
ncbi:TetR family transcriptional regulator [Gordonia sp. DT30]|uniref:TetR family transcriptional regulator n=1 Tax=unclassified Gordonia (in: high G+C Gram-positive bacteria) TaxID=2657482 RepID=UPI003CF7CDC4